VLPSKILVVDDSSDNVKLLTKLLTGNGYSVLQAYSGSEALSVLEKEQPDLILLDIMMPEMSGYEVCRKVRENPATTLLPVVMVTALDAAQERIKGIEAGADDFITKPINLHELLARVQSLLRIKALHDKIKAQAIELAQVLHALGDIGHDVKNMLTPVVMGASILHEELDRLFSSHPELAVNRIQQSCNMVIGMLRNSARRIQDRVKEIGDCVKGFSSPPHFAPCCMADIVENVIESLRLSAEEKKVNIATQGLRTLPMIMADESRIYNAFYNLINNAIPETPSGGSITISGETAPDAGYILVAVADTGRGMPADVRDSLFTARAISRKPGGTGLGTKIVKDVVRAHNGEISVESNEGKGTSFHIRLPLSPENFRGPQPAVGE
jgi:signal transduction histidine kinase